MCEREVAENMAGLEASLRAQEGGWLFLIS